MPVYGMTQLDKKLKAMKDNPQNDWHMEDLKALAKRYDIEYRQKGSHVSFVNRGDIIAVIPARKPLRTVYVKEFIAGIEAFLKIN